jgi:hypothetical protein
MHSASHPKPDPDDLSVWVECGLALRAGPADPAEVQRQLKHLRRLEPSARLAVATAGVAARADIAVQDFGACLRDLA